MTTLNDLTPSFRSIRLLLARERGHPAGERDMGYDILAPLDPDGRLGFEALEKMLDRHAHGLHRFTQDSDPCTRW